MKLFGKKSQRISAAFSKRSTGGFGKLILREKRKERKKPFFAETKTPSLFFWYRKYQHIFTGIFLGLAGLAVCAGILFFSGLFTLKDIALTRHDLRVNVAGISKRLLPLKGTNLLLISSADLTASLLKNFPELMSVSVQKKWPSALEVIAETFPIVVKWEWQQVLKSTPDKVLVRKSSFINSEGRVSTAEPADETKAFAIWEKILIPPQTPPFGTVILTQDRLHAILQGKDLLEAATNWHMSGAEYLRAAQEIHYVAMNKTEFWLDFSTPLSDQIAKISAAQTEKPILEKPPLYLDLRIPGKLIYHPQ